jgi:hypothetical protein
MSRAALRRRCELAVLAAVATGAAVLAATSGGTGDYMAHGPIAGDNAGPAVDALAHGHLGGVVAHQPLMGLTSIVLRAPVVAIAGLFGAGDRGQYAVGALVCLLPAVLLVAWVLMRAQPARWRWAATGVVGFAALLSASTLDAVRLGHPEELLAIALATGAVLAASDGRANVAAVLLGLAIGTKQWALLAAPSVVLALPGERRAVALKAGAVGLLLTAALPIMNPNAFRHADEVVGGLRFADPFSVWWPLGSGPPMAHATARLLPLGIQRSVAAAIAMVLALGAVGWAGRRTIRSGGSIDPLALLALLGLIRCVADPDPLTYNFADFLVPLAVWEATVPRRLPVLTLATATVVSLARTGGVAVDAGNGIGVPAVQLAAVAPACMLALAIYLAHRAFRSPQAATVPSAPLLGVLEPTIERT